MGATWRIRLNDPSSAAVSITTTTYTRLNAAKDFGFTRPTAIASGTRWYVNSLTTST